MKKIFTTIAVLCSLSTFAQSGSWYVGGALGYMGKTSKYTTAASGITGERKNSTWVVSPEIGTFLSDNWQLGLALGLNGEKQIDPNKNESTGSSISPTIYIRRFAKVSDNLSVFAGLYGNFASGSIKHKDGITGAETKDKVGAFGMRLGVGVAYALSDRFTAVGQYGLFGFTSTTTNYDNDDKNQDTSFDFGVNTVGSSSLIEGNGASVFNIGLYYTFKQ
jgi:opacity protein-like surface antigen